MASRRLNYVELSPLTPKDPLPRQHEFAPRSIKDISYQPHVDHDRDTNNFHVGYNLRRFPLRGIIATLVPLTISAYYFVIWFVYLEPTDKGSPIAFGPHGGRTVFYSWFIVGTIGLNIAEYGLEGVEASMLMDPKWALKDAMHLMMHSDHTWSGPGGWLKTIRKFGGRLAGHHKSVWPSPMWQVLAIVCSMAFIGLPISGLVMELGDGYRSSDQPPTLFGFGYDNFNSRTKAQLLGAISNWEQNLVPTALRFGAIYTKIGVHRSNGAFPGLQKFPNTLPDDDGVSEFFLSAQSDDPYTGGTWGLLVSYNCSTITKLSDFTILSQRNATALQSKPDNSMDFSPDHRIGKRNYTTKNNFAINYQAVMEFGYSSWQTVQLSEPFLNSLNCYYNPRPQPDGSLPALRDYPGMDNEEVFEVAFWQHLFAAPGYIDTPPALNETLEGVIPELDGAYMTDGSIKPAAMSAIGARCTSRNAVGTATIHGRRASYSNFTRTDTPIPINQFNCAECLSSATIARFFSTNDPAVQSGFEPEFSTRWLSSLFSSVSAPPRFVSTVSGDINVGYPLQLSYLQPRALRASVLRAYAAHAVQLVWNGGQGFSTPLGSSPVASFVNPNATRYVPGKVLQLGVVPPIVPGVFFALWAVASVYLGLRYGFRRRWAATLDGFSLFRFGADLAERVRGAPGLNGVGDFEDVQELRGLPGMVGDERPAFWPGHITLVEAAAGSGVRANVKKRYI